jgi:hypothetical protein
MKAEDRDGKTCCEMVVGEERVLGETFSSRQEVQERRGVKKGKRGWGRSEGESREMR